MNNELYTQVSIFLFYPYPLWLVHRDSPWWRHQMETFSALLALCAGNSPAPGEFPPQRPVTRSFDVFFGLRLNKRLSKQSWGWRFETLSCPLWRHCKNLGQSSERCNVSKASLSEWLNQSLESSKNCYLQPIKSKQYKTIKLCVCHGIYRRCRYWFMEDGLKFVCTIFLWCYAVLTLGNLLIYFISCICILYFTSPTIHSAESYFCHRPDWIISKENRLRISYRSPMNKIRLFAPRIYLWGWISP